MNLGFKLYFKNKTVFFPIDSLESEKNGNTTLYKTKLDGVSVSWSFMQLEKGVIVNLSAKSCEPLGLKRIDSLVFNSPTPQKTDRILFLGNNFYSSENRYFCELKNGAERCADCTGLFTNLASKGLVIAMLSPFTNIVGAGAKRDGDKLSFFAKTEFTEAMQNERILEAETVFFANNVTIDELFNIYSSFIPSSSFPMPKLIGWNTWDYYLTRITPEDIYENIDFLKKQPFADKLRYIVIDDGWQKDWGDWTGNDKFACGLDQVAKRITDAGFLPGIWAAPLLMRETSDGFSERAHWLCRNENGEPFRNVSETYLIDPTVPEAEKFILDSYKNLYSMGFRLFKIDYLSPLLAVKNFHEKNATPYSMLRNLIQSIQECTGKDAVILGCSLPIQCGADIAPSMRISVDVHNHFSHVKWIAESLTWTWQYNNRTTRIDPDFLVVRGSDTSNEPLIWEGTPNYTAPKRRADMTDREFFKSRWRQGDQFNEIEAETWSYLVALSGGNIFLSDKISALNERGLSLIERALNISCESSRPVFLKDDARLPSLWMSDGMLLLVNWEDVPVTKNISLKAKELRSDKAFEYQNDTLSVTLLPHESFFASFE